jgi:hypothetical protein
MTIDISNNNPRVSYAVAQGATQTSFTVNFEFFENADLNVYVDGTKKSLTTHYTVSGGSGSTGTVTMSVTGATGGSTVVITRDTTIERTTDFSAGADINRAALNTQLDTITAMVADIEDQASRAVQVSDHETAPSLELPSLDSRKGTVMGFNASTGAVEAGPKLADVSTLAAVTADIATLADIEDGTDATNAIQAAASNSSNINTVAGISGNVTTVAGVASNVTSVAGSTTNINTVAGSISNVNTTGSNISSVNTNATNISAIQGASANASTATTKASQAATSATNAASSATSAATAQTAAEAARDSALSALDSFDDRYLGAKSSAPSVDNDGNALASGALYYDTTANAMQVYTGSAWVAAYASLSGALLVTNNLSDLNSAANAATNLGLGTGNTPTFNGVNTTGDISFGDSDKAKFGASNDLEVYHDGNNSYVDDTGSGGLILRGNAAVTIGKYTGETMGYFEADGGAYLYHNNAIKFQTTSSGAYLNGSLGVGTNSPTHPLHVRDSSGNGSMSVGSSAGLEISHDNSGNTTQRIDSLYRTTSDNANLQLRTGTLTMHTGASNAERMRITSGGDVGVNVTPQVKMHVKGDTNQNVMIVDATGTSANYIFDVRDDGSSMFKVDNNGRVELSSGDYQLKINQGSNQPWYIRHTSSNNLTLHRNGTGDLALLDNSGNWHVDGNVTAYSTSVSDLRLKDDIKPIENALDKVSQINGYTFTYTTDGKQSAGVIAQEVEKVLPSAVSESTLPLKTDDDVEYKTVEYDQLVGLLIESVKELKAEIEELKNGASK